LEPSLPRRSTRTKPISKADPTVTAVALAESMIAVQALRHRYGDSTVLALDSWRAGAGEHCLILGASGSGKTTLLGIVAGLLRPSEGRVEVAGEDLARLSGPALDRFRGRHIGFVPQKLHLIASLDVEANLALAQFMAGFGQDRARVREVLAAVGLADRLAATPAQLSHGQAQRVAVARAVVNRPRVILADEPTSNLDDAQCAAALDLLETQAAECGATLVVATHDARAKPRFTNRLELG
jgi:putative ABC transport system ATP-binding protein